MKRRKFITLLGGVAAWPLVARAQRSTIPVIGYISGGAPGFSEPYVFAFRRGLSDTGYVEGRNVRTEYRWAEGRYDRLPDLAAELVRLKVDVIAASGGDLAALAAKGATSTIPIVFTGAGDPIAAGLVASLARPGGNVTGISYLAVELSPKRVELISELVPNARVMALLVNPRNANTPLVIRYVLEATRARGLELLTLTASNSSEIDAAFDALVKQRAESVIVDPDHFIDSQREQLVSLAAHLSIPAIYGLRELTVAGGLMSYGVRLRDAYRLLGIYTGTILKGARPSDLPVQQPTRFELVINLKTAKALGIAVPPTLLARADEVIE